MGTDAEGGAAGAPGVGAAGGAEAGRGGALASSGGTAAVGGSTSAEAGQGGSVPSSGGSAGAENQPPPTTLDLTGDTEAHDVDIIEAGVRYYLFGTGPGIPLKTSDDLLSWRDAGLVFAEIPSWIAELVPDASELWAPDVEWFEGSYHLYYAASTFGSGWSCIGHATRTALDSAQIWADQGPVICSDVDGTDVDWDAIDPNAFIDPEGNRWLVFGSFGSGIKLIRLNAAGARADDELLELAMRPDDSHAIQAAFLFYQAPYYYLFASFDWCCRGVNSTNNLRVGRATNVTGPYVDRDGVPMMEGGGTLLVDGDDRWPGVGGNSILVTRGRQYNVYHSYDATARGRVTLRIAELTWDADGWPISGGP
ncbi:MAG: arabinan endo-1,5-alpha-L-arabinosidase [Polyangiaceae bacterium]|nr:arabinan endo-1,5-alpha-L-arabinosidase [Polyangiaceae bacterium]